ncbi:MAG: acyl carrier protein [Lachnospiraceae bacterium]|nr:acyl carrier protein [Lachnospiraceae bacterium]
MKETVVNIVAEYLGKEASEVSTTETFKEIGLDSLDIMELVMQIEEETDCKIELSQDIDNIEKLCDYIEENK